MKVIDSSVALKWFFEEEESPLALELLQEELAAPDLILYELTNIFGLKQALALTEIEKMLDIFYQFQVKILLPSPGLFKRILWFSKHFKITAYDASFVALAEYLETSLITADLKLLRQLKGLKFVKSLNNVTAD